MFKKTLITLGAVAGLGFAAPGFAHPPQCDDDKSWQHCRDAQAAYLQRLNSDNNDLFHRTDDDRFSLNDSDSRYYTSAAGDRYYRNPADERYYRVGSGSRYYTSTADDHHYNSILNNRYYGNTTDNRYYRTTDGRLYRTNFDNRSSNSKKCVYFDHNDGRYYQKNCQ